MLGSHFYLLSNDKLLGPHCIHIRLQLLAQRSILKTFDEQIKTSELVCGTFGCLGVFVGILVMVGEGDNISMEQV